MHFLIIGLIAYFISLLAKQIAVGPLNKEDFITLGAGTIIGTLLLALF